MNMQEDETKDRLEALRLQFVDRCRKELIVIETFAHCDGLEPADRDDLTGIAHRLAGSGGTFGYPELSAAATQLEILLDPNATPADTDLSAALTRLIRELRGITGS